MSNASPTSPTPASKGLKRERDAPDVSPDEASNPATSPSPAGTAGATTSNFRNVSACNRCRNRKNRCDQKLPRCTNCSRANVKCVGFDPVSKREIPRSYVYYLETRVHNLEALLGSHGIPCPPASDDFPIGDAIKPGVNVPFPVQDDDGGGGLDSHPNRPASRANKAREQPRQQQQQQQPVIDPALEQQGDRARLDRLADETGMVPVRNASSGPSASASGISFARVVFAAVKRSVNSSRTSSPSDRHGPKGASRQRTFSSSSQDTATGPNGGAGAGVSTMRDSFFGLYTKPNVAAAPFPDRALGARLAELYFEYANPQIPVLHRGEFTALFERVYGASSSSSAAPADPRKRGGGGGPRELYLLNIVFAIGSGIIMDTPDVERTVAEDVESPAGPGAAVDDVVPSRKRQRLASHQHQPEEYHAAAIVHLETFLGSAPAMQGTGGGLEELQAVLLLAGLALLRPVAPGLWYIIGVAVRLSIDLGLHTEDIDQELDDHATHPDLGGSVSVGRKQWTRDLRRRLWWCVFNLDRLVSSCVGRPVSISETVVTTDFASLLDDKYITPSGFLLAPTASETPSYKLVSRHYLRLRLLQSEILQVLQHRQGDQARQLGGNQTSQNFIPDLNSPFLQRFNSFREWRADVDRRLWQWKEEAPRQFQTGVAFTPLFYDLNFWQAIIMLYRQSLAVPEPLANELSPATGEDVQSPGAMNLELEEDKQMVLLKVAQAGQTVLKIYRQLHRLKLVNYTFLATHHLFMSGISFLYAIWGSTVVRSQLSIDDVDFTVLAATSVLSDLIVKCPPAEACRDAFVRMSKATISMVTSTTGFGNASTLSNQMLNKSDDHPMSQPASTVPVSYQTSRRPIPKFDMNLRDLFSEEELASRPAFSKPSLPKAPNIRLPQHKSPRTTVPVPSFPDPDQPIAAQYHPPFTPGAKPVSSPHAGTADWNDYANVDLDFLDDFAFTSDLGAGGAANDGTDLWNSTGADATFTGAGGGSLANQTATGPGATATGLSGTGFDSSGAWEANGELFDTFFFGPAGGGNVNGF